MRNLMAVLIIFIFAVLLLLASYLTDNEAVENEIALFPDVKAWDMKKLKITDKNNKVLHFIRKNCVWTIGEEASSTNEARVANFADQVIGLTYLKTFTGNKEVFAKYYVDQDLFTYKVDITLPEGKIKTLYLGSTPSLGLRYARSSEDKNIYVLSTEFIKIIPMEIEHWLPESTY